MASLSPEELKLLDNVFDALANAIQTERSECGFIRGEGLLAQPKVARIAVFKAYLDDKARSNGDAPVDLYAGGYATTAWIMAPDQLDKVEAAWKNRQTDPAKVTPDTAKESLVWVEAVQAATADQIKFRAEFIELAQRNA